jgi:hypothetical protein
MLSLMLSVSCTSTTSCGLSADHPQHCLTWALPSSGRRLHILCLGNVLGLALTVVAGVLVTAIDRVDQRLRHGVDGLCEPGTLERWRPWTEAD